MAEKLEVSLQAQKRLLGDVSHELRSPMTRLQLALGLAQKSFEDPASLAKHLQRCETEVHRLDQMIADVLALSPAGKCPASPAICQTGPLGFA